MQQERTQGHMDLQRIMAAVSHAQPRRVHRLEEPVRLC